MMLQLKAYTTLVDLFTTHFYGMETPYLLQEALMDSEKLSRCIYFKESSLIASGRVVT